MTILEVFSCSGGMAEGLRRAGLKPDMAFDSDAYACDSYLANLGHRPVQMDARDLLRMVQAGWTPGPIDLLVADPPCTPWSRAGKRQGRDDDRDMLDVTVELVRTLRPTAYLIANVPGLDDAPNWPIVQETIGGLTRDGYCVADFVRLDAADYGVPQHRVRPFWYGHRGGPCIAWPDRTHGPIAAGLHLPGVPPLHAWVTCRAALGHLDPKDLGSPVRLRWRKTAKTGKGPRASHTDSPAHVVTSKDSAGDGNILFDGPNHRPSKADAPARTITRNTHGDGALLVNDRHPVNALDDVSVTVTARDRGAQGAGILLVDDRHPASKHDEPARVIVASDGGGSKGARTLEWPWDRPATTVYEDERLAPAGHHDGSNLSAPNAVKLSERAAAILQGFPDGWHFAGETKRARWSQIGQAMPPPLAEAVGRAMARALGRS
jgi:site-specific DNA-cytosine methylase